MRYDELYSHALKSWRNGGTAPENKEHKNKRKKKKSKSGYA